MKETSKLFRSVRKRLGLTQREFAGLLGTTRFNIANYETRVDPPGDLVLRVIKLCADIDKNSRGSYRAQGSAEGYAPWPVSR